MNRHRFSSTGPIGSVFFVVIVRDRGIRKQEYLSTSRAPFSPAVHVQDSLITQ